MGSLQTLLGIVVGLCFIKWHTSEAVGKDFAIICSRSYDNEKQCERDCSNDSDCKRYQYKNSTSICELEITSGYRMMDCLNRQQLLKKSVAAMGSNVGCGAQADKYEPVTKRQKRIVGGTPAKPHSWPWTLLIFIWNNSTVSSCGATLIRASNQVEQSDIVVTAAHCVTYVDPENNTNIKISDQVLVFAGLHARDIQKNHDFTSRLVTAAIIKSGFDFRQSFNDLAVLKLNEPIQFNEKIRAISLPEEDEPQPIDKTCYAAGWGRIQVVPPICPDELQQLNVPVQTPEVCQAHWGNKYNETSCICAGGIGPEATSGVSYGDSGGMLACQGNSSDPWVLHGVCSLGAYATSLRKMKPSIFTRISTNVEFILQAINNMNTVESTRRREIANSDLGGGFDC